MKREQLDKINGLLNQIAEIEKILAIKSEKISILEYNGEQYRYKGEPVNSIIIQRQTLVPVLSEYILQAKEELKELGYEEGWE